MGFLGRERKECGCVGWFGYDKCAIGNSVYGVNVQLAERGVSRKILNVFLEKFSGEFQENSQKKRAPNRLLSCSELFTFDF